MGKQKRIEIETTVADAITIGTDEIRGLQEEMEEWRSNIEDKFSSTDKYSRVEEAAQALEGIADSLEGLDDCPDAVASRKITVVEYRPYGRKGPSRATRASSASAHLSAAVEGIREYVEAAREAKEAPIADKPEPSPEAPEKSCRTCRNCTCWTEANGGICNPFAKCDAALSGWEPREADEKKPEAGEDEDLDALDEFANEVEEAANEIDNVEFPGMFG